MAKIDKRSLTVTMAGTDVTAQVSKVSISSAESESDFVTFADAAAGGARDYKLNFTAAQDAVTGTLWDKIWSAPGTTVTCLVKPYGNAAASITQPHYSCSAVVSEPDGDFIGGEADKSVTAVQVVEVAWALTGKPTKVTV